jgi:hypothetical protein
MLLGSGTFSSYTGTIIIRGIRFVMNRGNKNCEIYTKEYYEKL